MSGSGDGGGAGGAPVSASRAPGWTRRQRYARWFQQPLGRAYRASIERVLRPWIESHPGRLALDAGCGPILTFVDVFPRETPVLAVDCSLEMARGARSRLEALERPGLALCASVEHLPFPAGRFDSILSVNCLEFVADPRSALRELARVAASEATLVIGVLNRAGTWEWARRVRAPFSRTAYHRGRFFTARELVDALTDAGWRVEELRRAVRFPPLPLPGPGWYRRVSDLVPDSRSGVLLARARRSAGPDPDPRGPQLA